MDIWEAKYKALCLGISNKDFVDNAVELVEAAAKISQATFQPLDVIVSNLITATHHFQSQADKEVFSQNER